MKFYNLLLILFMVALKCAADEEPTTVKYSIVENVTNSEVFNASATENKLPDFNSSSEASGFENTLNNAPDNATDEVPKKKFGLPISEKLEQGFQIVKNVIGGMIKGLTHPNEAGSKKDVRADCEEATTVNYSKVENVTNSELINTSTTETQDNLVDKWTQLPNSETPVVENTLINATNANAVSAFKNKEFGKLAIPRRMPQYKGIRIVTSIVGSLMKGIAQLNKPDSKEDIEADYVEATTVNNSAVENITNGEVSNTSTTDVPDNASNAHVVANTLINATDANAASPFKKIEFGKLSMPRRLPQYKGIRKVANITGSLMEGLAHLNEPDSKEEEEDAVDDEKTTTNYSAIEYVSSSEVSNTSTTEGNIIETVLPRKSYFIFHNYSNGNFSLISIPDNASNPPVFANTLINATDANAASPFKKIEFGKLSMPRRLPQYKGIRKVANITGSLMEGLAHLNEPDSKEEEEEDAVDDEKTTTNYSAIEYVSSSEVSNTSTTEVPDNASNPPVFANTLINATDANAASPFEKIEFGKLPMPRRLPQHKGIRKVANIKGSLMEGLAHLNEPDSNDDTEDDGPTTINNPAVENVTCSETIIASTTEAPETSTSGPSGTESTLINVTNVNAGSPFKKKDFGKLPIPIRLPQEGIRLVKNVIGRFVKGFVLETDSTKDAD